MASDKFKKQSGMSKQAWLDWLADEAPAPAAKEELRRRFEQQANSYQPRNRTAPQPQPQVQSAAPIVSQPTQTAAPTSPAAPGTVSIQIHLPSLHSEHLRKLKAWFANGKTWLQAQLVRNKRRTIGVGIGIAVLVIGLFVPPLFNFGYGKPKVAVGSSSGASAGATTAKYDKPPFTVVRPSTKPKLATPDGVHAVYDGARNTYSYSDSIGGNGFTVSQQPLPAQFKDGEAAIAAIGPTLNKGVTPIPLQVITGSAAVSTNPKYNSQVVVASVRDVLVFIQSSHAFKNSEWQDYLNTLQ